MKCIITVMCCVLFATGARAADLTASATPSASGKKEGKITLLVSGGFAPYTFSWTGPGGYSSTLMNPGSLDPGTYCVTVTDQYCGTASLCVTIEEKPTAIGELETASFSVYPNPFGKQLFIRLGTQVRGIVQLELFDNSGKLVARLDTEAAAALSWDLSTPLAAGNYTLCASLPDGSVRQTRVQASGK
ncbi:MAG TPA: T9SS type A sorting domain-containing protein [Chitinophagaceae bacterium]|nr:T9SS type A sorting domain-containing protein [Chitinophagaceae bacterium]